MYYFPNLEPVHSSVSGFNCCFLTCIQIPPNAGKVVWYSHLFQNFPQFVVVHAVKGFGIVNKAEIDFFFWNSLAFSMIHWMLAIWPLVPLPFLNPAWTFGSSWFMSCWSLAWRIWSFYLTSVWDESNCAVVWWWNLNCVAGLLLIIWQLCKAISLRKSLLIVNKWVFKTLPYSFVILFSLIWPSDSVNMGCVGVSTGNEGVWGERETSRISQR